MSDYNHVKGKALKKALVSALREKNGYEDNICLFEYESKKLKQQHDAKPKICPWQEHSILSKFLISVHILAYFSSLKHILDQTMNQESLL